MIENVLLQWIWITFLSLIVFILPGFTLFTFFWSGWRGLTWLEILSISGGVGLAIYPILYLWGQVVHIPINQWTIHIFLFLCLLLVISREIHHIRKERIGIKSFLSLYTRKINLPIIIIIFFSISIFFSRLWILQRVIAPMWGDSVSHTVSTQLLYENQGLFNSWQPYAPYSSFTVQFGFPASSSIWMWITKLSNLDAVLIVGQVINFLAVIAIYPIALKIASGNLWAALGSLIIAGLLSPLPNGYTNWGRYAQLTGQAILPILIWLIWGLLENFDSSNIKIFKKIPLKKVVFCSFVLCGMLLSYYRLVLYFGTFILAFFFLWIIPKSRTNHSRFIHHLINLFLVAFIAFIFFLPWFLHIQGSTLVSQTNKALTNNPRSLENLVSDYLIWKDILQYVPISLVILFFLGIALSIFKKQHYIWMTGLWVFFLFLLVASQLIKIPIANFMQNFAVMIALYIPISVVAGWFIGIPLQWMAETRLKKGLFRTILIAGLAVILLFGIRYQSRIINPKEYAILYPSDLQAMEWIQQNTPNNAVFLVEGMLIPPGTSVVGTDAGWWIPLLGLRENTMPPQYAMLNEAPEEPGYNQKIVNLVKDLENTSLSSESGLEILCKYGISYIYIGQALGKVSYGNQPLYTKSELKNSPYYQQKYKNDNVRIFKINQQACSTP